MSIYYSKFQLNTFWGAPYFEAHMPPDYPICLVCQKAKAFRRLPPNVKKLAALARKWRYRKNPPDPNAPGIHDWYDEEGYELDPSTGKRLTDEEIDQQWPWPEPDIEVKDIPEPEGGFPDPDTWEEPPPEPDEDEEDDRISWDQLVRDIGSHGREYVARDYGVPKGDLADVQTDEDLAGLIFARMGRDVPVTLSTIRAIGDKWKGPSGRWFTKNQDGHVVPTTAPGDGEQAATEAPAGKKQEAPKRGILSAILEAISGGSKQKLPPGPSWKEVHKLSISDRIDNSPAHEQFSKSLEDDPNRRRQWEYVAHQSGMGVDEVKKTVREKMQRIVDQSEVFSRVPDEKAMLAILEGGFKNQFQLGKSAAVYDPKGRAIAEARAMGVPMDTPHDQRPIYGYLSSSKIPPEQEAAEGYGDFIVKLKPHMKERSTISFGDSFRGSTNNEFLSVSSTEASHNAIHPAAIAGAGLGSLDSIEAFNAKQKKYIEAHMHGGVTPDDIESIRVKGEPSAELRQRLDASGIKWESY